MYYKVKKTKVKSTGIFPPPSPHTTIYNIYAQIAHKQCQEPKKVPILKKTTGLCPSRSYYSMVKSFQNEWPSFITNNPRKDTATNPIRDKRQNRQQTS